MKPEAWSIMSMIPQWDTITSLYQQLTICPVFNSEHGLISQAIKLLIVQLVTRPNASQKRCFQIPKAVWDYLRGVFFEVAYIQWIVGW